MNVSNLSENPQSQSLSVPDDHYEQLLSEVQNPDFQKLASEAQKCVFSVLQKKYPYVFAQELRLLIESALTEKIPHKNLEQRARILLDISHSLDDTALLQMGTYFAVYYSELLKDIFEKSIEERGENAPLQNEDENLCPASQKILHLRTNIITLLESGKTKEEVIAALQQVENQKNPLLLPSQDTASSKNEYFFNKSNLRSVS